MCESGPLWINKSNHQQWSDKSKSTTTTTKQDKSKQMALSVQVELTCNKLKISH